MFEVWTKVQSNSKMILWCDGLLPDFEKNCSKAEASRAGKRGRERNDSDLGKKKQDREEKAQEIVENLKWKRTKFTSMQIWAEIIVNDIYSSVDDPSKTSMFA